MNTMVQKRGLGEGYDFVVVLEPGNIEKMKQGDPVFSRVEDMFPDGIPRKLRVIVAYSDTPVADARGADARGADARGADAREEMAFDERTPIIKDKRPHCPECKSTIEQYGVMKGDAPTVAVFCPMCGCVLGVLPKGAV